MAQTRAKIFTHGGSQAVRLPKAFRFAGTEVSVRRDGDRVILEPVGYDAETFWARIDACPDSDPTDQPQAFVRLTVAPTSPDVGAP